MSIIPDEPQQATHGFEHEGTAEGRKLGHQIVDERREWEAQNHGYTQPPHQVLVLRAVLSTINDVQNHDDEQADSSNARSEPEQSFQQDRCITRCAPRRLKRSTSRSERRRKWLWPNGSAFGVNSNSRTPKMAVEATSSQSIPMNVLRG